MIRLPKAKPPRMAFGIASVVLGTTGLMLFFLPVLGIPLSSLALLIAILGTCVALVGGDVRLRWSVLGLGLSLLALGINFAIAYAPAGYIASRGVPHMWQGVNDRPSVPPPARPGNSSGDGVYGHAPPPREVRLMDAAASPATAKH
jgi:hypothetical protein